MDRARRVTPIRRGQDVDGKLALHALRHTWEPLHDGRADDRTWLEKGGWTRGNSAHVGYDHGDELEGDQRDQEKVANWLKQKG
jgi:hypothetical protein